MARTPTRDSDELARFLSERFGVDEAELRASAGWIASGSTIGSLALRLGALSLDEIQEIVQRQVHDDRRFGELGVALGHLTSKQVEALLEVQRCERCVEQAGVLIVSGRVDGAGLLEQLAEWFGSRS